MCNHTQHLLARARHELGGLPGGALLIVASRPLQRVRRRLSKQTCKKLVGGVRGGTESEISSLPDKLLKNVRSETAISRS